MNKTMMASADKSMSRIWSWNIKINNNTSAMQSVAESSVRDGGWHVGNAYEVKLNGVGISSSYDAQDHDVYIFPHLP